ncbi:MAG: glycosyltransferase family 2 protein [Saprospiraceae bacterium]|nr:glycosyltransferase family 2 protein [Saprospiraceae bacterium]
MELLFWILIFIVFYSYLGYGLVLFGLISLQRLFKGKPKFDNPFDADLPDLTFVVAAYNEADYIQEKIENGLLFDYPKSKLHHLYVTDGSDDGTDQLVNNYSWPHDVSWSVHHKSGRAGKIAAVERIMEEVNTPIVVYTDANTMVNKGALKAIARHYQDPTVGGVAGEKRIHMEGKEAANAAGEGLYWKYESQLKKWDSEWYSVVGAAGELFSLRTELYQPVPKDTVIEDFYMTLKISMAGYKIKYEPEAYAVESSSASVGEELKRKIRIAAGGLQAISRLLPLLNIFKYGKLSFQYISHRVLRWTLAPIALPLILILNLFLLGDHPIYLATLASQIIFYLSALIGVILEGKKMKIKAFFIPYYFCVMNYAVYRGFGRFVKGSQSVVWERAKRA